MSEQLDHSFRGAQRALAAALPPGAMLDRGGALELAALNPSEAPRLIAATLVEGGSMRRHQVGEPVAQFAAFLDGTQVSRVMTYRDAVPVVHGTVAAVVRERRDRRMGTWGRPIVRHRLYVPRALVPAAFWERLESTGLEISDTSDAADGSGTPHPFALRDAAIHRVQKDRERAEHELAEQWCGSESRPLFVDGGISGSAVAQSSCAVGVVKSHRTLYVEGADLVTVLALGEGERSSVLRITSPRRTTVASWYLRLRDASGRDPLWGLVRVEMKAEDDASAGEVGHRADEISRWILAETSPVSLPDARWDKMVYGIRDCEEFLKVIQ
ncbi:MAG: hypothetical protein JWO05_398 [Gemmatimonadetes bacterium]|nr:hypothetical protein [Gemmatimonadota bacterium]